MRICFLSSLHPPTDKRVFDKEAVSLAAVGFEVVHLATGTKGDISNRGVRIVTEPSFPGIWGRILSGPRLYLRARRLRADCYHCNEVDSWIVGVALKFTCGCKLVFDAHEAYPEGFAESRFPRPFRRLVSATLRLLFRVLLLFTDRVVLAKESIAGDYPNPSKRVLVRNYVSAAYADQRVTVRPEERSPDRVRIIHLGLISRMRGWPQLLEAVAASSELFELVFVGQFNDRSEADFREHAGQLGVTDSIRVVPWLPFADAFRLVCSSDLGIIAFQPGHHNHVQALPHKMFDYMAAGIPVVAPAFAVEVSRIVREADCGLLVDPSNSESIREVLEFLARRPEERARLGENGRRAIRSRFNWENEASRLEEMYRHLSTQLGKSPLRGEPLGTRT